jgi:succinate dehydrogenase / fumarate reductase cytochrome b subunit
MEARSRSLPRRLHAISGLVPVGAFLAFHLYANSAALQGPDAYDAMTRRLQQMPLAIFLEVVLILLPLAFHGLYGLFVMALEPSGEAGAGPGRRGLSLFQRATGILLFAFLLFHLWTTRLVQVRDHESLDLFRVMQALYASPWIRAGYVAGLLAATAHLSAGLWSFADDWGLARSRAARLVVGILASALFVTLSAIGLRCLAAFRL